jgi:hypothetical protein
MMRFAAWSIVSFRIHVQQVPENLEAAYALWFAYYNWCRVHSSLRVTPCMEAGIESHIWTIAELIA